MTNKQPSFSERVQSMCTVADNLRAMRQLLEAYAQEIAAEAERMAAAEKRFADRRRTSKAKASR